MKRILRTSHCLPAIRSWQHFTPHTATGVNCRFVWLPDHDMTVGRWDWLFCFSLFVSIWMKPGCLTMTVWTLIFPMVCFSDCLIPYPVSLSNDEMRRWSGDFWPRCKYIKHHLAVFILVSKKMDHVYLNVNEGWIQMFDFIEQSGNIDWDDGRFRNDDVVGWRTTIEICCGSQMVVFFQDDKQILSTEFENVSKKVKH